MHPENRQRPAIRHIADLNSCMARRLQVIYGNDFSEGLVNQIASLIEKRNVVKRLDSHEDTHLSHGIQDIDKVLHGFTEWADNVRNSNAASGHAGCSPLGAALLLELVGAVVQYSFSGYSGVVNDSISAILKQRIAAGECVTLLNEMTGLIIDIVMFAESAGKKENGLRS